ncbi:LysM peptidoglycan-binding domain-containing protein [Geobacter sp.]|uniref:CIS tube protein n=1 Tax=Geobacter sp. TaxID=46610 RepID=UPI00260880E6|nr:LysM peptidoglycan-binding domain-containing protein [Geobacter sp.]
MGLMKALIINTDAVVPVPIPVMFNPPEYQLQKTNQYAEIGIPGLGSSLLQFVRGSAQTLSMELFFDTTDLGLDVRAFTGLVLALTDVNSDTHAPPRLLFVWGSLVFPCVLESVSQRFEYFNSLGMPLRARLNVTLKGNDKLEDLLSSIPLLSADRAKRRVVASGDTLQSLAAQEYGDSRLWRAIAEANGIDSPLGLTPGQGLIIPTLT